MGDGGTVGPGDGIGVAVGVAVRVGAGVGEGDGGTGRVDDGETGRAGDGEVGRAGDTGLGLGIAVAVDVAAYPCRGSTLEEEAATDEPPLKPLATTHHSSAPSRAITSSGTATFRRAWVLPATRGRRWEGMGAPARPVS